jgi:hypothetical protein
VKNMRKLLIIGLMMMLSLSISMAVTWQGSGTQGDPYLIENQTHLECLDFSRCAVNFRDHYFILANDIILNSSYVSPYDVYNQHIDGRGHTISNYVTNQGSGYGGDNFHALIEYVYEGTSIINLNLEDFSVTAGGTRACLVGYVDASAGVSTFSDINITGCVITDTLGGAEGDDASIWSGGLIGASLGDVIVDKVSIIQSDIKAINLAGGIIGSHTASANTQNLIMSEVFYEGNVATSENALFAGALSGAGGIIGSIETYPVAEDIILATISDSYAIGDIAGYGSVGGIVGKSRTSASITDGSPPADIVNAKIIDSYYIGTINDNANHLTGGIASDETLTYITDIGMYYVNMIDCETSYYETTGVENQSSTCGEAKSDSAMKTEGTYSGWDFTTKWAIDGTTNSGYPYLMWFYGAPIACTPSWVCDAYAACDVNDEELCNSVTDENVCGESYTGNYSEFTPNVCDFCTPSWVCDGYVPCDRPNPTTTCNSANDTNACGEAYAGDYSGFATVECSYSGGGSVGTPIIPDEPNKDKTTASTNNFFSNLWDDIINFFKGIFS